MLILWLAVIVLGVGLIVWGAELFAENLAPTAVKLQISSFALALLLAGAEPEELATAVTASLKEAPAIAFGDVVGANIAICLVALGVGGITAPLPFGHRVLRYAWGGLGLGIIATSIVWDGMVDRLEGLLLVVLYVLYVGGIWLWERQPPALGETGEIAEAMAKGKPALGRSLGLVMIGFLGMVVGSILLVEAVKQISSVEETQTKLSLSLVGFATALELVVLAWSASRRGADELTVAGVVGSFAYNLTMTLGTAAIARPLVITDARLLHLPLLIMLGSLLVGIVLALWQKGITKLGGGILLALYPLALIAILLPP